MNERIFLDKEQDSKVMTGLILWPLPWWQKYSIITSRNAFYELHVSFIIQIFLTYSF